MMADCLYRRPASRHTRRMALAALLLAGMAPLGPGGAGFDGHAMAAPAHAGAPVVMDAEDLDLSVPCLGRFEIMVDPAMSDGVSIDSSPSGGAHLTMRTGKTQGSSKVLITSRTCAPNARVSILVAPNVGVMIHDSHDTHIVIHGTLASLEASLEAGQLDADTIQSLDLSLRGTEQVHIANLNRAAQVVETGASGLVVDHADLDAFSAQLSETSHLSVTDGRFDVLTLMVENAASVRLGGSVNTATVSANGTGLVAIPNVSGPLTRTGNVQIGTSGAPQTGTASPPVTSAQAVPAASSHNSGDQTSSPGAVTPVPPATPSPAGTARMSPPVAPSTGSVTPGAAAPANLAPSPSGAPSPDQTPVDSGIPSQGLNVQNPPAQTAPTAPTPQRTAQSPAQAVPVPPAPPSSNALSTDQSATPGGTPLPSAITGAPSPSSPPVAPARPVMPRTEKTGTDAPIAAPASSALGASSTNGATIPGAQPAGSGTTTSQPGQEKTVSTPGDPNQ